MRLVYTSSPLAAAAVDAPEGVRALRWKGPSTVSEDARRLSEICPLVRPCLDRLEAYRPGKPIEEVRRELGLSEVYKLASNENPLGPSREAIETMQRVLADAWLYPEDTCFDLVRELSAHLGVPAERLIIGRGSDELIHLIGMAFVNPGEELIMADPPFPMYPITATQMDGWAVRVPLQDYTHDLPAMAAAITPKTKVIFIANPHNPTGTIVRKPELEAFLSRVPDHALVVMDEAYCEFVDDPGYPTSLDYVAEGRNVVVLRTFSKIYALAGLRVGYGVFPDHLAPAVKRVRPPFNVSTVAQAAAVASLRDAGQVARSKAYNIEARRYLCGEFDRLGLAYAPSQANFILVDLGVDCVEAFQRLLRRGYIVRTGDVFDLPTHVRVSFGTPEQNAGFIAALEQVLAELR